MSKIVLPFLCLFVIFSCKKNKSSPAIVTVSTNPVAQKIQKNHLYKWNQILLKRLSVCFADQCAEESGKWLQ
jgi:hypothetical protein